MSFNNVAFNDMFKFQAILLIFLFHYSQAQDANCDFSQTVNPCQTYYVYSPRYPNSYTPGTQCRWIAFCPSGYNCRLDCSDVNLPYSTSCTLDRLLISRTGDPQLTSADYYCGRGSVSAVSTGQKISVGLITSRSSPGGQFLCILTAQIANTTQQCSCGYKKRNRIVSGEETGVNEFPMRAGLFYRSERAIRCGAVIIELKYVLTAAHCVNGKSIDDLGVIVGDHDISTGRSKRSTGLFNDDSPATQGFRVSSYLVHPQYNPTTYDADIAIVTIVGEITFSEFVGPVCLPFKYVSTDFNSSIVTLLGWGTLQPGGETSNVLRKVDVNVISQATCRRQVSTLTARQICTNSRGKDSCQDDSGGPALYTDRSTGLLFNVGIISFGPFCASEDPGVITRVASFLDWIVRNAPANYCRK